MTSDVTLFSFSKIKSNMVFQIAEYNSFNKDLTKIEPNYDKNDDIRLQVIDGPTPIMSYLSFLDFGVRTYVDFLKICSFKVSGQIGMNTDHQSVLHPNIANGMSAGPIVMIRFPTFFRF